MMAKDRHSSDRSSPSRSSSQASLASSTSSTRTQILDRKSHRLEDFGIFEPLRGSSTRASTSASSSSSELPAGPQTHTSFPRKNATRNSSSQGRGEPIGSSTVAKVSSDPGAKANSAPSTGSSSDRFGAVASLLSLPLQVTAVTAGKVAELCTILAEPVASSAALRDPIPRGLQIEFRKTKMLGDKKNSPKAKSPTFEVRLSKPGGLSRDLSSALELRKVDRDRLERNLHEMGEKVLERGIVRLEQMRIQQRKVERQLFDISSSNRRGSILDHVHRPQERTTALQTMPARPMHRDPLKTHRNYDVEVEEDDSLFDERVAKVLLDVTRPQGVGLIAELLPGAEENGGEQYSGRETAIRKLPTELLLDEVGPGLKSARNGKGGERVLSWKHGQAAVSVREGGKMSSGGVATKTKGKSEKGGASIISRRRREIEGGAGTKGGGHGEPLLLLPYRLSKTVVGTTWEFQRALWFRPGKIFAAEFLLPLMRYSFLDKNPAFRLSVQLLRRSSPLLAALLDTVLDLTRASANVSANAVAVSFAGGEFCLKQIARATGGLVRLGTFAVRNSRFVVSKLLLPALMLPARLTRSCAAVACRGVWKMLRVLFYGYRGYQHDHNHINYPGRTNRWEESQHLQPRQQLTTLAALLPAVSEAEMETLPSLVTLPFRGTKRLLEAVLGVTGDCIDWALPAVDVVPVGTLVSLYYDAQGEWRVRVNVDTREASGSRSRPSEKRISAQLRFLLAEEFLHEMETEADEIFGSCRN